MSGSSEEIHTEKEFRAEVGETVERDAVGRQTLVEVHQ